MIKIRCYNHKHLVNRCYAAAASLTLVLMGHPGLLQSSLWCRVRAGLLQARQDPAPAFSGNPKSSQAFCRSLTNPSIMALV